MNKPNKPNKFKSDFILLHDYRSGKEIIINSKIIKHVTENKDNITCVYTKGKGVYYDVVESVQEVFLQLIGRLPKRRYKINYDEVVNLSSIHDEEVKKSEQPKRPKPDFKSQHQKYH